MAEYRQVLEWDQPNVGCYEGEEIRIITSRSSTGQIGACHAADLQEIEMVGTMAGWDPAKTARIKMKQHWKDKNPVSGCYGGGSD